MAMEIEQTPPHTSWSGTSRGHHTHYSYHISSATISNGGSHIWQELKDDTGPKREVLPAFACSTTELETAQPVPDRDLWTRNLSIIGLILGWGCAISSLATGLFILLTPNVMIPNYLVGKMVRIGPTPMYWPRVSDYIGGHRVYQVTDGAMLVIPVVLQAVITLITGSMASIHATTLRWALWHEGRLKQNSNLRLFTSSKRNGPNKWLANIVISVGLVLACAGASIMTFPVSVMAVVDQNKPQQVSYDLSSVQDRSGIDFNGWGLIGLGAGLVLQATICTWALFDSAYVGTWNANPLATARACRILQETIRDPFSITSPSPSPSHRSSPPREPCFIQPSPLSLFPATRTLANLIWFVFAILCFLVLTIALLASRPGSTRSFRGGSTSLAFVERITGDATPWHVWQYFGMVERVYNMNPYNTRKEWVGLLIQCLALAVPLFGLHVAETLGRMRRDESLWRRASTVGVKAGGNLIREGWRNWTGWVLFACQCLVPWIFSYAIACNRNVFLTTLPTVTVAVLFLGLGVLGEYLVRKRPRGAQPATYGDVQALVALVDDWDCETIFWGDKGVVVEGEAGGREEVRLAGTAGRRLADLVPGVLYRGLDREGV